MSLIDLSSADVDDASSTSPVDNQPIVLTKVTTTTDDIKIDDVVDDISVSKKIKQPFPPELSTFCGNEQDPVSMETIG
jgi:hypothetical protein